MNLAPILLAMVDCKLRKQYLNSTINQENHINNLSYKQVDFFLQQAFLNGANHAPAIVPQSRYSCLNLRLTTNLPTKFRLQECSAFPRHQRPICPKTRPRTPSWGTGPLWALKMLTHPFNFFQLVIAKRR